VDFGSVSPLRTAGASREVNISVAELDEAVTWQSATIGVTAISSSRDYLPGLMRQVEDAAVRIANDLGDPGV
jgi:uncharacterized protein YlxP (DUF503 family)